MSENLGFSFIEVLVSISIFIILLLGIYSLMNLSLKISQDNKYYSEAISLANQRIEEIHNLAYEKVGTVGGSPAGVIPEKEIIKRSAEFSVSTTIIYYDDPYDGTLLNGDDQVFTDYKLVSTRVSWQGRSGAKELNFFTKIIPNTEESPSGYGLLKISVVDANGAPIPSASITVSNNQISPIINSTYITDQNGFLVLPAPPSLDSYEVHVTKNGYSHSQTYARSAENPNPNKPNYSVFAGQKTEDSFSIDRLASVTIETVENGSFFNYQLSQPKTEWLRSAPRVIFISDSNLISAWQNLDDAGQTSVYLQKFSNNGSLLWPAEKKITSGYNPDIVRMDSERMILAWQTSNAGSGDINYQMFDSAGQSLGSVRMANQLTPGDHINPRMAAIESESGATTTMVWQDSRNGDWDVYAQIINNLGQPILSNDFSLGGSTLNDETPSVSALDDGNFLALWIRNNPSLSGKNQMIIQKFNSSGEWLWPEEKVIGNSETLKNEPEVTAGDQGSFYLIYSEGSQPASIVLEKYDEQGSLIWGKRVNQNRPEDFASSPGVAYANNSVAVSWVEEVDNNSEIYSQKYDEQGDALWANDMRINSTIITSSQNQPAIKANAVGDFVGAWRDNRNGYSNIYTAFFGSLPNFSHLGNVPITVTGSKRISDDPVIYKVNQNYNTNSSGFLDIPLEWDTPGYTISINPSYSESMISSEPELPFIVKPGEKRTVILHLK